MAYNIRDEGSYELPYSPSKMQEKEFEIKLASKAAVYIGQFIAVQIACTEIEGQYKKYSP